MDSFLNQIECVCWYRLGVCIVYFTLQVLGDKTSRESMLRLDYKSRKLDREEKQRWGSCQQILTVQKLSSNSQTNSHRPDKLPTSCSDRLLQNHLLLSYIPIFCTYPK